MQKMHIANSDKPVILYSLDVILAVGYRVNSAKAIRFRQWATDILHKHLIGGYTINRPRIAKNYEAFLKAVDQVKNLLPTVGERAKKMKAYVEGQGKIIKKLYFSYTTCPKCAKAYGKNYVVLFAQID